MRTYKEFIELVNEAWHPPFKKLPSGKTPMQKATDKSKTNSKIDLEKVRTSARRYGDDINNPNHDDYEFSSDKGTYRLRSKKHPIEVSYTKGDKEGSYIQNTIKTGEVKDRVGAGREMQRMKAAIASKAKPGVTIHSQPVGDKRAALNSRLGMSSPNDKGVQTGIVAHRSPRQLAKKKPPMNPGKHSGIFIDPNH